MNWHALFAALAEGKTVTVHRPSGGSNPYRLDRHAGLLIRLDGEWLPAGLPSDATSFEVEP